MKSIDVSSVPMYIDGSSGSMWPLHQERAWLQVLGNPEMERRRYVKVSDLIQLLTDADIKLTYGKPESEKT